MCEYGHEEGVGGRTRFGDSSLDISFILVMIVMD